MRRQPSAVRRLALSLVLLVAFPAVSRAEDKPACDVENTRKQMDVMFDRDVHARLVLIGSLKEAEAKKGGKLTMEEMAPMAAVMTEADRQNQAELDQIVAACGWPTKSGLGAGPVRVAARIMIHAPSEFVRKHYGQMWASYQAGETSALRMATVIDDELIEQGKPQRFGTRGDDLNANGGRASVEDPEHLEERRRAFGIPAVHTLPSDDD